MEGIQFNQNEQTEASKFLLAANPFSETEPITIIHTQYPQAIVQCIPGHLDGGVNFQFTIKDRKGEKKEWTFHAIHLFVTETNQEEQRKILGEMFTQMFEFFNRIMQAKEIFENGNSVS